MDSIISGVLVTPLAIIPQEKGDVMHCLKEDSAGFAGFGEAYFSKVNKGSIKGWKQHTQMTLNLTVPVGAVQFVLYDARPESSTNNQFYSVVIGPAEHYARLTIPPHIWVAFRGVADGVNLLLNIASIKHDPTEAENLPLDNHIIPTFSW